MAKKKGKSSSKPKSPANQSPPEPPTAPSSICQTLEEDEITRCSRSATHGSKNLMRCQLHYKQYVKMHKDYKDASQVVDELLNGSVKIPAKKEIEEYKDWRKCIEKAHWLRKYVEAIRVEKTGREIHSRRFFLKIDSGHRLRMKVLAKQVTSTVEVLDALQGRAFKLYNMENNPDYESHLSSMDDAAKNKDFAKLVEMNSRIWTANAEPREDESESEDDNLIGLKLREEKERLLFVFRPWLDSSVGEDEAENPEVRRPMTMAQIAMQQFMRRCIFYDPVLYSKASDKVSFKDFLLHPDITMDDLSRIAVLLQDRLGMPLLWMKDSFLETNAMVPREGKSQNAANIGSLDSRVSILGGWIYNRRHESTMTNEGWFNLLKALGSIPADIENRFVRLCNNFDDLHSFLSFIALDRKMTVNPPSWCKLECLASRNHLSLSGVLVADLSSPPMPILGPVPTMLPARRQGMIAWAEVEIRAYMFGAVRNEPDQFTEAFLNELRARPDLFCVITRSDTDPGQKVETFGGMESEPLPQMRGRNFEAPFSTPDNVPAGYGEWNKKAERTGFNILYSTEEPAKGYLVSAAQESGWFFHFKRFPVKYFVIIDVQPGRPVFHLSRAVAWAALRAQGFAEGEYTEKKYARASDQLFQKHAKERLAWMGDDSAWWTTSMEFPNSNSQGGKVADPPRSDENTGSVSAASSSTLASSSADPGIQKQRNDGVSSGVKDEVKNGPSSSSRDTGPDPSRALPKLRGMFASSSRSSK